MHLIVLPVLAYVNVCFHLCVCVCVCVYVVCVFILVSLSSVFTHLRFFCVLTYTFIHTLI